MVTLTRRRLNRTLLHRQRLLARSPETVEELVGALVGVQAQEPQGFYQGLAARLEEFDPAAVTHGLEERRLVRFVSLRRTVHLSTAADAVALAAWTRPLAEKEIRVSQSIGAAREVDRDAVDRALSAALADGPIPLPRLSAQLAACFPEHKPAALGQLARSAAPLCQVPPRGAWKQSGGVVYDDLHRWTGLAPIAPDPETLIRRYLRAFGPATAADVTTWSGITGLAALVKGMDLARYEDEDGRVLFDVPDAELAEEDAPAPVRLLGTYDNVWLAHAGRDRVTTPDARRRWMGANGGTARVILVDGQLAGLWREQDGRPEPVPFAPLTGAQQQELDDEVDRTRELLAR